MIGRDWQNLRGEFADPPLKGDIALFLGDVVPGELIIVQSNVKYTATLKFELEWVVTIPIVGIPLNGLPIPYKETRTQAISLDCIKMEEIWRIDNVNRVVVPIPVGMP